MFIKRSEYQKLKFRASNAEFELEQRNKKEEVSRDASVSVWYREFDKNSLDFVELENVCFYTSVGGVTINNRYIFYDKHDRPIASICNVVDMFFDYPEKKKGCACNKGE